MFVFVDYVSAAAAFAVGFPNNCRVICCVSAVRRSHETARAPVGKRLSRDDLDMLLQRRRRVCPVSPPPRLPPKTQPHHQVLNSYDLNALSCTDSVKDAVHFYENIDSVSRQRP